MVNLKVLLVITESELSEKLDGTEIRNWLGFAKSSFAEFWLIYIIYTYYII